MVKAHSYIVVAGVWVPWLDPLLCDLPYMCIKHSKALQVILAEKSVSETGKLVLEYVCL